MICSAYLTEHILRALVPFINPTGSEPNLGLLRAVVVVSKWVVCWCLCGWFSPVLMCFLQYGRDFNRKSLITCMSAIIWDNFALLKNWGRWILVFWRQTFCLQADNVTEILTKQMAPGVLINLDDFLGAVEKDVNFKPFGDLLHSYKVYKSQYTGQIRH